MKYFLITFFSLFGFIFSQAQITFEKKYTVAGGFQGDPSICSTPDGGYAMVESTINTSNAAIIRVDSVGNLLWKKQYSSGSSLDYFSSIISTHDHGFAVCGQTNEFAMTKIIVLKMDSVGNVIWSKYLGDPANQLYAYSIQETANNDFIVMGNNQGQPPEAALLACLDQSGNQLWSRLYSNQDIGWMGEAIACRDNGFLFIEGIRNFSNETFMYVIKTDSLGQIQWGGCIRTDSIGQNGLGMAVRETYDNEFLLAGSCDDSTLLLVHLDAVGHIVWTKKHSFGFSVSIYNISLDTTQEKGFILAMNLGLPNGGYLVKLDNAGNIKWSKKYGTSNYEQFHKVICLPNDNGYAISGITNSGASHPIYFVKTDTAGISGCEQIIPHFSTNIIATMDTVKTIYPGVSDAIVATSFTTLIVNEVDVCGTASIDPIYTKENISVFPNPSSGSFTVFASSKILSIQVFDLFGNVVFEKTVDSNQETINLSSQSKEFIL